MQDPRPRSSTDPARDDARFEAIFAALKIPDPGPRDRVDPDLERRLEVLFQAVQKPQNLKPTDLASLLAFTQELWDRLYGR